MRKIAGLILLLLLGNGLQAERYLFKAPVNLGPPVNTEWFEADPYITADGQKLFFVSDRPGGFGNTDIWMSTWNGTTWTSPVNLGANVNGGLREWSPSVSPDGKKLYFLAFGLPGGEGSWDVWMSEWDSILQQWGPAQNLGVPINTPYVDWCPEISRDGLSLYYATNGYGHPRGQALYSSQWDGDSWSVPDSLPYFINNSATEERPSVTADGKTLYFVRWQGIYNQKIFVTEKDSTGNWLQPFIVDTFINTPHRTSDPYITPDGKKLYFASTRPGGLLPDWWDIWVSEGVLLGDLNLDGQVTAADVVLELNKVFLNATIPASDEAADGNCDGNHSPADVVLILLKAFSGTRFPC